MYASSWPCIFEVQVGRAGHLMVDIILSTKIFNSYKLTVTYCSRRLDLFSGIQTKIKRRQPRLKSPKFLLEKMLEYLA